METDNIIQNKKGLRLKFAGLYILSLALVAFIISVFIPRSLASDRISVAKPIDGNDTYGNDLLSEIDGINVQYKNLKQQDQVYLSKIVDSRSPAELTPLQADINESEKQMFAKIDNLNKYSKTYSNQKVSGQLRNLIESYHLIMDDRSKMRKYETALLSKSNNNTDPQGILKTQNELQVKDSRIIALENQISALGKKKSTEAVASDNNNISMPSINATDALNETIATQEKKITSLTAIKASLENDIRISNNALEQAKKISDNSNSAVKNQTTTLEKKVIDLNAEIRFAQVDCSLARVDATQIISNARQRKALLAEALNTLNTLSATGDAGIKKRVFDKIVKLNQVASTVRD